MDDTQGFLHSRQLVILPRLGAVTEPTPRFFEAACTGCGRTIKTVDEGKQTDYLCYICSEKERMALNAEFEFRHGL
jgi:hypothetical protein